MVKLSRIFLEMDFKQSNRFALIEEGNKNLERKCNYYFRVIEKYWLAVLRKIRTSCRPLKRSSFIKSQMTMPEQSLSTEK